MFFGGLIALVAIPLLFWNEGRAVYRARTLAEGRGLVQENISNERVDDTHEGALVHMSGTANSTESLSDETFGITVENAIRLDRIVEMFQWKEEQDSKTEKKLGGGTTTVTTFNYKKVWSEDSIDSSDFEPSERSNYGDGNPEMPFTSSTNYAKEVNFGAFQLSDQQVRSISGSEKVAIDSLNDAVKNAPNLEGIMVDRSGFFVGLDPEKPAIGDMRIRFEEIGPTDISFVYKQNGNSFAEYKTKDGSISLFSIWGRNLPTSCLPQRRLPIPQCCGCFACSAWA
ncbi:MAG: TMEM43 family protein [Planctomycetota bacterium]